MRHKYWKCNLVNFKCLSQTEAAASSKGLIIQTTNTLSPKRKLKIRNPSFLYWTKSSQLYRWIFRNGGENVETKVNLEFIITGGFPSCESRQYWTLGKSCSRFLNWLKPSQISHTSFNFIFVPILRRWHNDYRRLMRSGAGVCVALMLHLHFWTRVCAGMGFSETVEQSGKLLLLLSRFGKHTWFCSRAPSASSK